jgi:hypothetical protein
VTICPQIAVDTLLVPGIGESPLVGQYRVLGLDADGYFWVIEIPAPLEDEAAPTYFRGPRVIARAEVEEAVVAGTLALAKYAMPSHWQMTDQDYLDSAPTDEERNRRAWRIEQRDEAWELIAPIVSKQASLDIARRRRRLRSVILARASECDVSITTVYNTLHRFMALGGVRNALMPNTHRCGAPGKQREQGDKRLGRIPRAHDPETANYRSCSLSEDDKNLLARGYQLVGPDHTVDDAYWCTCTAFWSDRTVGADGRERALLWPAHRRPTKRQFVYWGKRLSTPEHRAARLALEPPRGHTTHHGGSSQDLVAAVGQLAMLDSTTVDAYLTSPFSRLRYLSGPTRTIVKDVRTTAYVGLHCGWEPTSPRTALLAIFNAARTPAEKVALARTFGIESTEAQWCGALFRTYLTDNGEMRAAEVLEAERQIGFSVIYTKVRHGPGKGDVESQHHVDQKKLDHRIPGTTKGKRRKRGEKPAADRALWNFREYMRELILHVLEYNNTEVPHLAPVAMLQEGIAPTRVNIFNWLLRKGQRADLRCDIDLLRAFTLPAWQATIEHNGIYLKDHDDRRLPLARFYSDALLQDERFQKARRTRTVIPASVRADSSALEEIWFPSAQGLVRVPNVAPNPTHRTLTVAELIDFRDHEVPLSPEQQQRRDQAEVDKFMRRQETTDAARKEKAEELEKLEKRPSKTKLRKGIRQNVQEERARSSGVGPQVDEAVSQRGAPPAASRHTTSASSDAAEEAMSHYLGEQP